MLPVQQRQQQDPSSLGGEEEQEGGEGKTLTPRRNKPFVHPSQTAVKRRRMPPVVCDGEAPIGNNLINKVGRPQQKNLQFFTKETAEKVRGYNRGDSPARVPPITSLLPASSLKPGRKVPPVAGSKFASAPSRTVMPFSDDKQNEITMPSSSYKSQMANVSSFPMYQSSSGTKFNSAPSASKNEVFKKPMNKFHFTRRDDR